MHTKVKTMLAAGTAALVALAVASPALPRRAAPAPVATGLGIFNADCGFANRAADDPIVLPGQSRASHMHDFFGGRVDAFSTNASIRREGNCLRGDEVKKWRHGKLTSRPPADRSRYWVPTLYDGETAVEPKGAAVQYGIGLRRRSLRPFPEDLRVIAGRAKGGPRMVSRHHVYRFRRLHGRLELNIRFPDCWNGRDSDSADHKSHMAYSERQGNGSFACPPLHPVAVPQLELKVHYPAVTDPRLASGDLTTAHADFMNGWDPRRLEQLVRVCLNADEYCGGGSAPAHGRRKARTP